MKSRTFRPGLVRQFYWLRSHVGMTSMQARRLLVVL